jgi:hypothetical protein
MFASSMKLSAALLVAGLAVAQTAEAGGYAGNGCVAKKQAAAGKFAKAVGKAWVKYPADMTARNEAIDKAAEKLSGTWTKNEEKAASKGASCDESTETAIAISSDIEAAVAAITAENFTAATDYVSAAMKAWGKYIKDPVKDPGKVTLDAALAEANSFISGENATVSNAATALVASLVEDTTTAPNYPTEFQTIAYGQNEIVQYGKEELRPTCVDDDPYMFFAKKGTTNNVLMYYQGGGACWNDASCNVLGTCDRVSDPSDNPALTSTGFANYNDPANPFFGWNVVFVSYCSCDIHWGEKTATNPPGQPSRHYGRVNAMVAEKFAREHFLDPENVYVTGSSAGSYGAIMNSYWLMKDLWPNAQFAVMGDAGVGVITKQWLDRYIKQWGVINNFPDDIPGVEEPVENLSLVDLIDGLNQRFPDARFANYDSSYDGGGGSQANFFQVMRHPVEGGGSVLDDWGKWYESACDWNACMREFKAENASREDAPGRNGNYRYYTSAGSRHTIFGSDKVYTETKNTDALGNPVTFAAWVQAMIDGSSDWVDVDCNHAGGNCNLTFSCQGGTNAGATCAVDADCGPKTCTSGATAGNVCTSSTECSGLECIGGTEAGTVCAVNADCDLGVCARPSVCTGTCQKDSDANYPPAFNNDGNVSCGAVSCPCGPANAECFDGPTPGASCATNTECSLPASPGVCSTGTCSSGPHTGESCGTNTDCSTPNLGSCSYVNCSNQP